MCVWRSHAYARPSPLNAFVVCIGFLIPGHGAVNTAIIGSNGVHNRVAEDGVMPSTGAGPHPHQHVCDTYRILYLIVGLQLATILFSGGEHGDPRPEAYAFWRRLELRLQKVRLANGGAAAQRTAIRTARTRCHSVSTSAARRGAPIDTIADLPDAVVHGLLRNFFTGKCRHSQRQRLPVECSSSLLYRCTEHYHEKRLKRYAASRLRGQFNQSTAVEIAPQGLG